jgi:hypothetical protein
MKKKIVKENSMQGGFHKFISTLIIFSIFFIIPPKDIFAQTDEMNNNLSFVVNSQKTFYGFNAGSINKELRFRFKQQNRQNFLYIDLFENNQFYTIGAYNSKGIFILIQDHPGSQQKNRLSPSEFENHFSELLFGASTIPDLNSEEYSINKWIIPNSNLIFADKFGNTVIIYSDNTHFQLYDNELPYLAVTYRYPYDEFNNNLNNEEQDIFHTQLMDELNKTDENFSVEFGLKILTEFQPTNDTLTSILISPNDNQVFVSLDKNANEVWRFDIYGGTVETHSGFDQNHKANIPKLGITSSDLKILNFSNEGLTRGIIAISIAILLIIIISIVVYFPKNIKIQQEEII